jgi:glycosyltransferase involved in cell wall biosynthesis
VGVANVYLEAMASGCPVVASSTGGAPEAVVDGETGLLVEPGDVEATAAALDRVLGDAALRERMGDAGRRRVDDYFAMDRYVDRVLATYARAIDRSRERYVAAERAATEGAA